jgi:hypothetical protein
LQGEKKKNVSNKDLEHSTRYYERKLIAKAAPVQTEIMEDNIPRDEHAQPSGCPDRTPHQVLSIRK